MFITFEGGEGVGKTTQIKKLAGYLESQGRKVVITREPGGSPGAEILRELLVKGEVNRWDNVTEVLLFYAARRDHVEKTIKPALDRGEWVISDRFADSTTAYQLYGYQNSHLTKRDIDAVYEFALGDFKPDLTIIFDMPVEVGIERKKMQNDEYARFENKGVDFHNNLRRGYLEIAGAEPDRCKVIDASRTIEAIEEDVLNLVQPWLF